MRLRVSWDCTGHIVMVENIIVGDLWLNSMDVIIQAAAYFLVKLFIDSLPCRYKFPVHQSLVEKKSGHEIYLLVLVTQRDP